MTQDEILKLPEHGHVKIFLMNQLGLTNREIADIMAAHTGQKSNPGRIFNDLKSYAQNPIKVKYVTDKYLGGD